MSSASLTLEEVALLALGVPEEVKFNMLRVLLLAMLKLLNVGHHVAVRPEKDGDYEALAKLKDRAAVITSQLKERALSSSGDQPVVDGLGGLYDGLLDEYYESIEQEEEEEGDSPPSTAGVKVSGQRSSDNRPATAGGVKGGRPKRWGPVAATTAVSKSASAELAAKVSQLEQRVDSLTSLPTAKQVIERAADVSRAADTGGTQGQLQPALVSDLWQAMQMQRKIETNEQGVTQLMKMVEELVVDAQKTKAQLKDVEGRITSAEESTLKPVIVHQKLALLENNVKTLQQTSNEMIDKVSQSDLHTLLKDVKMDIEDLRTAVKSPSSKQSRIPSPEAVKILLQMQLCQLTPSATATSATINDIFGRLDLLTDRVSATEGRLNKLREEVNSLTDNTASALNELIPGLSLKIDDIEAKMEALHTEMEEMTLTVGTRGASQVRARLSGAAAAAAAARSMGAGGGGGEDDEEEFETLVDLALQDLGLRLDELQHEVAAFRQDTDLRFGAVEILIASSAGSRALPPLPALGDDDKPHGAAEVKDDVAAGDALGEVRMMVRRNEADLRDLAAKFFRLNKDIVEQVRNSAAKLHDCENKLLGVIEQLKDTAKGGKVTDKSQRLEQRALANLQEVVANLAADLQRINVVACELLGRHDTVDQQIAYLADGDKRLDDAKADRADFEDAFALSGQRQASLEEKVAELEARAAQLDKMRMQLMVNSKNASNSPVGVSRSTFDKTREELHGMVEHLLTSLNLHEVAWQAAMAQLGSEVKDKMDRLEFGHIRGEVERQLRTLGAKMTTLNNFVSSLTENDAAGLCKQLLKFNCISCARPKYLMPHHPLPSIPTGQPLPFTPSMRPYTTYELASIRRDGRLGLGSLSMTNFRATVLERQAARCRMQMRDQPCRTSALDADDDRRQHRLKPHDPYFTGRACGGNHTVIFPHHRVLHENVPIGIDSVDATDAKPVSIRGSDGRIYKGFVNASKSRQQKGKSVSLKMSWMKGPSASPVKSPSAPTSPVNH